MSLPPPLPTTPTTTIGFDLDDFGGSSGTGQVVIRKRVNYPPAYLRQVYRTLGSSGGDAGKEALFRAQSELNALVASGGDLASFKPAYLSQFPAKVTAAFESIKNMFIEGQEGDYEFVMPPVIKNLVNQFSAQGKLVPWEVVDAWKKVYSEVYNNKKKPEDVIKKIMGDVLLNNAINKEEFELYTSTTVIEQFTTLVPLDKKPTGFSGVNDDILNPLYADRKAQSKNDNPVKALIKAIGELNNANSKGLDAETFTPDWLEASLAADLTPDEVEQYMDVYEKARARRLAKYGNVIAVIKTTLFPPSATTKKINTDWFKPDERLRAPYDKLMSQGKLTQPIFDQLKAWTTSIVNYVKTLTNLDTYDAFYPETFAADLAKLTSSVADQQAIKTAYEEIRTLVKAFIKIKTKKTCKKSIA